MAPQRGEFQEFLTGELPRWAERIVDGETVRIDGRVPEDRITRREREFLKRRGIISTLLVPLHLHGKVVGFVGFDRNSDDAGFADEDASLLCMSVNIIGNALERKQSEYSLQESEDLYRTTLDSITDAVSVVDTDLRLILANDAFRDWCSDLGLDTDVTDRPLFDVLPFLTDAGKQQYHRVARTGQPLTTERSYRVGRRSIVLRETKIPIVERGEVDKIITVIRDITRQKQLENTKLQAYTQIERNMEQFALLADHIRNPLQVIQGMADLIESKESETIAKQVRRINHIIDQLDERWGESRRLSTFWRRYS